MSRNWSSGSSGRSAPIQYCLLALGLLASSAALAGSPPKKFMGERVRELPWYVLDHQPIVLHATDSGPIPEESEHLRFVVAGHLMKKADDGMLPNYRWQFGIELLKGAKPSEVLIEDVTGKTARLLVDDRAPTLAERKGSPPMWSGQEDAACEITRGNDCATWIYGSGLQLFVFRAIVTFADGQRETLYQAAAFYPERMRPVFQAIGVKD